MRSAVKGLAITQSTPAARCSVDPTTSPQPVIIAIGICCVELANFSRQFPPAHPRHTDIGKNAIELARAEKCECFSAVPSQLDVAMLTFENVASSSRTKSSSSTTSSLGVATSSAGVSVSGSGGASGCRKGSRLMMRSDNLRDGKRDAKLRALTVVRFDIDVAAMPSDDAETNGESESETRFAFGGEERIENASNVLRDTCRHQCLRL